MNQKKDQWTGVAISVLVFFAVMLSLLPTNPFALAQVPIIGNQGLIPVVPFSNIVATSSAVLGASGSFSYSSSTSVIDISSSSSLGTSSNVNTTQTMTGSLITPLVTPPSNLVPNPTLNQADGSTGLPVSWVKGGWGVNSAVFTYPVTGYDDKFAAKVQISSYTSGDAKWYFNPVAITPGSYQLSDYYQSNVSNILVAQYTNAAGQLSYIDLATLAASATWKNATVNFTVPAGTTQIAIFHLINSVGWLTIDDFSLTAYTAPVIPQPPAPTASNLILNPSLEYLDAAGLPIGWAKGGWGGNVSTYTVYHPGSEGANAGQVSVTSYTDGDAKWYFTPVTVKPNYKYAFKDYYQSNVASYVTVEEQLTDGTNKYVDLGSRTATSAWTQFAGNFSTPPNVKAITVYHLIKAVGWLRTDNFGLAEVGPSQLSQGVVSLNFDDGWLSAYQKAYPIIKNSGFKSTFYIFTDSVTDPEDYMTLAQVKTLYAAGNEIGSHSTTHSDLTTVSASQLASEVSGSKTWFSKNGINTTTFAYPYGAYNQVVEAAVKNAGYSGARTSDTGDNDKASNKYELRTYAVLNTTTSADIQAQIKYAQQNKVWLILLFHEILDNTSSEEYSTTPAIIQATVNYLAAQKVPVLTNAQVLPLIQ
jgi:peptidoglycan/xylan/chitin deacetylase (PgdA/CDA1 family)